MSKSKKGGDIPPSHGSNTPEPFRAISRMRAENPLYTKEIDNIVKGMQQVADVHQTINSGLHQVGAIETAIDVVGRSKWSKEVSSEFLSTVGKGEFTPEWLLSQFSNHDIRVLYSVDTDPLLNPIPKSEWARREALLQRVLPSGSEILFQLTPAQLKEVYSAQYRSLDFFGDKSFLLDVWHKATRSTRRYPTTVRHETTDFSLMIQTKIPGWTYCLELITDQARQAKISSDEGKSTALLRECFIYGEIEQLGARVRLDQEERWAQWLATFISGKREAQ